MNPNSQAYYSSANDPGRRKRMILIVALIVLIIGSLAYLIFGGSKENNDEPTDKEQASTAATFDATVLSDFEFVSPDMKGYIKRSDFTVNVGDYTTTDNACNLQFGVVPGSELPGISAEEIASAHLGASEQAGATNATPKKGKDLVLAASNGKSKYSFPTLDYNYRRDNVNYKASYSIVILAQNKRAFVRRYCANSEGTVSTQAFNKINDKAKQIKVRLP